MKLLSTKYYLNDKTGTPTFRKYFAGVCISKKTFEKPAYTEPEHAAPKEILIVKTDSIGDYFLIRNFWEILRNSKKYHNANITLILSSAIRGIPEFLDSNTVKHVFYVPHPFWIQSNANKFEILEHLFATGLKRQYDAILFPNFNVYNFLDFNIMLVNSIASKETVATTGEIDPGNRPIIANFRHFTRVIPAYTGMDNFEFNNNKLFFEEFLDETIPAKLPTINLPRKTHKTCVINPCAQDDLRRWHPVNYSRLIKAIKQRGLDITLIGGPNDKKILDEINLLCDGTCRVVANAPWPDTIRLINNSSLYIGNDSGTFHLAAALRVPTICISGGMSWQRFVNYPKSNHIRIVIDSITYSWIQNMLKDPKYRNHSLDFTGNVNTVPVLQVLTSVDELLSLRK